MPAGGYLDCELFVADATSARLAAAGRHYEGRPSLDESLEEDLRAEDDPQLYGRRLFEALLPAGNLRAGYRESLAIARHTDQRLRLRLFLAAGAPAGLQRLDWEYLYDPEERFALGRSGETALSRYLSVERAAPPPVEGTPRLLIVLAAPRNLEGTTLCPLDLAAMEQSVEASLEPLRGLVDYEVLAAPATLSRIRQRLVAAPTHMLLLQGHGVLRRGEAAGLVLEDEDRQLDVVDEASFAEVLGDQPELRLVTLLACHSAATSTESAYSGLGPALVERGVPAVVAMRREIRLEAASFFLERFLGHLAASGCVDAAVNEARMQLYTRFRGREWGVPALYLRLRDGRIWAEKPRRQTRKGRVHAQEEWDWKPILRQLRRRHVIPILGPGILHGLLPDKETIARNWADEYEFPWDGTRRRNLPLVAEFVETRADDARLVLREHLTEKLLERLASDELPELDKIPEATLSQVIDHVAERYFAGDPDEPHHVLASLPIDNYLTTNVDGFLYTALSRIGNRRPRRGHCLWTEKIDPADLEGEYRQLVGTKEEPLIFHLFGHDEAPARFQVLTEDDHFDFLRILSFDPKRIPPLLHEALKDDATLIFLGYRIDDLDCRVLFRGFVKRLDLDLNPGNVTVLQFPESERPRTQHDKEFFKRYCQGAANIYYGSTRQFLLELQALWREENGG